VFKEGILDFHHQLIRPTALYSYLHH